VPCSNSVITCSRKSSELVLSKRLRRGAWLTSACFIVFRSVDIPLVAVRRRALVRVGALARWLLGVARLYGLGAGRSLHPPPQLRRRSQTGAPANRSALWPQIQPSSRPCILRRPQWLPAGRVLAVWQALHIQAWQP
jgi:hypothetical protein